jgi:hypothetical protein
MEITAMTPYFLVALNDAPATEFYHLTSLLCAARPYCKPVQIQVYKVTSLAYTTRFTPFHGKRHMALTERTIEGMTYRGHNGQRQVA